VRMIKIFLTPEDFCFFTEFTPLLNQSNSESGLREPDHFTGSTDNQDSKFPASTV
jgi:hypothetical protein